MTNDELKKEIEQCLSEAENIDWIWNGKDEMRVSRFNKEQAIEALFNLFLRLSVLTDSD